MSDAFISYKRKPSAALARLIQVNLKNDHHIDAYVDTTRADSTRVQFPERLMKAIEDAPTFICLLGDSTLDSKWVREEISQAYKLRKHCIPVFQEAYVPIENRDEAINYLLKFDGVHIFDVKNIFVDESVTYIADLVIRQSVQSERLLEPWWKQIQQWAAGVIVILVLIVVIIAFLLTSSWRDGESGLSLSVTEIAETETRDAEVAFTSTEIAKFTNEPTETPSPSPTSTPSDTLTPPDTPTNTSIPTPLRAILIVRVAQGLQYMEPDPSSAQIGVIPQGVELEVLAKTPDENWYKVDFLGRIGWIFNQQVDVFGPVTEIVIELSPFPTYTFTSTPTDTETPTPTATNTVTPTTSETPTFMPTDTAMPTNTSPPTVLPTPTLTIAPTQTERQRAIGTAIAGVRNNSDWQPYGEPDTTNMMMMLVPVGEYEMGSSRAEIDAALSLCRQTFSDCQDWWFEDESLRTQTIRQPFWIDETEVTRALYQQCVNVGACQTTPNPGYSTRDNQPITRITWSQAQNFCGWRDARLPTDIEWEYVARGPDHLIFPWGNSFDGSRTNYCDSGCPEVWADRGVNDGFGYEPAPVGNYQAGQSWVGTLDMVGNVYEWVNVGGGEGLRGGSYVINPGFVRTAVRARFNDASREMIGAFAASVISKSKATPDQ